MRSAAKASVWAAIVLGFCLPLFIGLGQGDLRGDEGMYSFGVDRILETGEWLIPMSSPHENTEFLEKPPLKFWIVALPIRLGLLPHDEFGLRFWDALFGAIGFLYVFAIGRRMAGPLCGAGALVVLFSQWTLLFGHGLRSNNMEAPLFLCYCGGIYHFLAWTSAPSGRRALQHALAIGAYFALGFMVKDVAAIFLPVVMAASIVVVEPARKQLAARPLTLVAGAALAVALIAPWFIYAYLKFGARLWQVMFMSHVFSRMTDEVAFGHVKPWNYYVTELVRIAHDAESQLILAFGFLLVAARAIRTRWVEGRIVLIWFVVPLVAISTGTSKLTYYLYPYLPALALMAAYVVPWSLSIAEGPVERFASRVRLSAPRAQAVRAGLYAVAAAGVALAIAWFAFGQLEVHAGAFVVKSRGAFRPLAVAFLAMLPVAPFRPWLRCGLAAVAFALLPLVHYRDNLAYLTYDSKPLGNASACIAQVQEGLPEAERGINVFLGASSVEHATNYYFRRIQPWTRGNELFPVAIASYGSAPAAKPAIVDEPSYRAALLMASQPPAAFRLREDDGVLLFPGRYAACKPDAD